MRVLELFSGSATFSGVAKDLRNAKTLTCDKFIESDLMMPIEDVTKELIIERLGIPTAIWASPVCSAWSKTGWFYYWDTDFYRKTRKFKSKSDFANESIEMVRKSIEIFSWFPEATFFMENPQGMLQRHPVINQFIRYSLPVTRHLVTYCQYGDTVMKPTQIWTNSIKWKPKKACSAGDPCHISSPMGTMKGSRSKKDSFERSKIPVSLCKEIIATL